jgi:3-hydroxyisobutyryl-CoA hydrolase
LAGLAPKHNLFYTCNILEAEQNGTVWAPAVLTFVGEHQNCHHTTAMLRKFQVIATKFGRGRFMSSTPSQTEAQLLTEQSSGGLLQIVLNRPKALNALTLDMVRDMNKLLSETINIPETKVGAFIMKGAGGKAFCAGGDVKTIWQELASLPPGTEIGTGKPGKMHTDFFREEYIMNYRLAESLTPQVSIWDGFVMGGGVGVSIFGEFRVATEKAVFAMPETAIGLFPDVGGSSWLPHLKDGVGAYIGKLPIVVCTLASYSTIEL